MTDSPDPAETERAELVVEAALFYDDPEGRGRVFGWLDQWTRKDGDSYLPLAAEAVVKALLKAGLLGQSTERACPSCVNLRADIAYRQEEKEITLHVQDEYSTALRAMAARLTRERRQARAWEASYDWHAARLTEVEAENVELRKLIKQERPSVGDMIIETARRRVDLAAARKGWDDALDAAEKAAEALVDQGQVMERMSAEMRRMDAENANLRRLCADQLAREGQALEAPQLTIAVCAQEKPHAAHDYPTDSDWEGPPVWRCPGLSEPSDQAERADTPAVEEVR